MRVGNNSFSFGSIGSSERTKDTLVLATSAMHAGEPGMNSRRKSWKVEKTLENFLKPKGCQIILVVSAH